MPISTYDVRNWTNVWPRLLILHENPTVVEILHGIPNTFQHISTLSSASNTFEYVSSQLEDL